MTSMLTHDDGQDPSNGSSRVLSNGSDSRVDGGGAAARTGATSNGTHKYAGAEMSINGSSSQNGKATSHMRSPAARSSRYLGHDREEVTRLLIQALTDMGYTTAAESVSRDSGYQLESPTVAAFRTAVLDGEWRRAEELLLGATYSAGDRWLELQGNGLVLAPGADRNLMRVWLRQQKFLELLERRETAQALAVLRHELTPLCSEQHQKLHFLSSLLMCQSPRDLMAKAEWDGTGGRSRQILLSELSRCISPSVMLPEHRLAVLLHQVKDSQISQCLFHTSSHPPSLYADHMCDRDQFPNQVVAELGEHGSEVWQVAFSNSGDRVASCGLDPIVTIWRVPEFEVLHKLDINDNSDVGNVSWSPDDSILVTCGRDKPPEVCGYVKLWDTKTGKCIRTLDRFDEPVSSCVWAADSQTFVTGSLDKNKSICQWNTATGELQHVWTRKHRTEGLTLSPDGHWLVAMDDQSRLHVYSFITRELQYELELGRRGRPTSVSISADSRFLLVNKQDNEAQLFDLASRECVQTYRGHTGGEFLIRSAFGGADESFVISGSEDGAVCIWHKSTGIQVERLDAHHPRCNAVCWNPTDPCMFVTCGDDGKVKVWSNKERLRNMRKAYQDKIKQNGATGGSSRSSINGWRPNTDNQEVS